MKKLEIEEISKNTTIKVTNNMMRLRYDFNPIVQFYTLQLLMMSFIIFVYENRMIQRKSHHKISGQ